MKKVLLFATLLATATLFAQEKTTDEKTTIALTGSVGNGANLGLVWETHNVKSLSQLIFNKDIDPDDFSRSSIMKLSFIYTYPQNVAGEPWSWGSEVKIGQRSYIHKKRLAKGFFIANYWAFGNNEFNEKQNAIGGGTTEYYGKYRYFSFVAPEMGWRFQMGNVNLNFFLNTMWKIELKGKGHVDNKDFSNWDTRLGLSIGYKF